MDWTNVQNLAVDAALKLATTGLILFLGWRIIKLIDRRLTGILESSSLDPTLHRFVHSLVRGGLWALLLVSAASMLGLEMTSFVALIGAAGLAIGLAFQGSLSNLAGGVLLLVLRPFSAGDYIEGAGHAGSVEQIGLFYTDLRTPDNKRIIVPNAQLSNSSVTNYSYHDTRRVDLNIGVSYDADTESVKRLLLGVMQDHPQVLRDPEPFARLSEHGDSALVFTIRAWCAAGDYWTVHHDLLEGIKQTLDAHEIGIPYPQMDVRIVQ